VPVPTMPILMAGAWWWPVKSIRTTSMLH
jgi:hypothetical protein